MTRRWAVAFVAAALANVSAPPTSAQGWQWLRPSVNLPSRPAELLSALAAPTGPPRAVAALTGRYRPPPVPRVAKAPRLPARPRPKPTVRVDALRFAVRQLGKPYRWGSVGPDRWDCSGLVLVAYRRAGGVRLPHQTEAMLAAKAVRRIRPGQLRPGDLVWPQPGHVALYLGRGRIVHAASPSQGVRVDALWAVWAAGRIDP